MRFLEILMSFPQRMKFGLRLFRGHTRAASKLTVNKQAVQPPSAESTPGKLVRAPPARAGRVRHSDGDRPESLARTPVASG